MGFKSYALAAAAILGLAAPPGANAATVGFGLGYGFSGTAPSGTAPWLDVMIADMDTAGTVQVTITTAGLTGADNVSGVYLNVAPSFAPLLGSSAFSILHVGGLAASAVATAATCPTCRTGFKADGDGYFNLAFSYGTGQGGLQYGLSSIYAISADGLSAASFLYSSLNGGGVGTYYAAAHVQNTGPTGSSSGWIGATSPTLVPVPAAAWLFTAGLGGLMAFVKRRAGQPSWRFSMNGIPSTSPFRATAPYRCRRQPRRILMTSSKLS